MTNNMMTPAELAEVIRMHEEWVNDHSKGKRAVLVNEDLRYAGLGNVNLEYADLTGATLIGAELEGASLRGADLRKADLRDVELGFVDLSYAILSEANLNGACLKYANLRCSRLYGTNLRYAKLEGANLSNLDLRYANLTNADLTGATLIGAELDESEKIRKGMIVKTPMIGWKKCKNGALVKLEIPIGAIVFSINNYKCRTNRCKVLEIIDKRGSMLKKRDRESRRKCGKSCNFVR